MIEHSSLTILVQLLGWTLCLSDTIKQEYKIY